MHYDHTAALFQSLIEQMSLSVDVIADLAGSAADGLAECMSTGHNVFAVALASTPPVPPCSANYCAPAHSGSAQRCQ